MKIQKRKIYKTWKMILIIFSVLFTITILLSLLAPNLFQSYGSGIFTFFSTEKSRTITIASADPLGHYNKFCNLLKNEIENNSNYRINVLETEGTLENIKLLNSGKADFALVQGALGGYEHIDKKELKGIAGIGWQYVHIIVPENSDISDFNDLKGKKISLGPEKSGNAALGYQVIKYFWKGSDIDIVHSNASEMESGFRNGNFDAFFAVYDLHAPILEKVMDTGKYRIVPINAAESIAGSISGCFKAILPDSIYGIPRSIPNKQHAPFITLKVKTYLIAAKKTNKYIIEKILRSIFLSNFISRNSNKDLSEATGRIIKEYPIHEAAKRFFNRNDPLTSDMYEIGSAYIAAFLFIAGIMNFLFNQRKKKELQRRKENIIPYFEELVEFSKRLSQTDKINELEKLLDEMMTVQRKAEKEWLEGKLDTEHMENLYSVYGIRCENIYNKMTQIRLKKLNSKKL